MSEPEHYSIKQVGAIVDEEQHVLRYWEREFSFLNPIKNEAGNRMYSSSDLAIVKELKRLIRTERKTIQEARTAFNEQFPEGTVSNQTIGSVESSTKKEIMDIKSELDELLNKLRS